MTKLTQKEKDLLFYTRDNRGSGQPSYCCELGPCKPWRIATINSAVKKGLVTIDRKTDGCVFVSLTTQGNALAAPLTFNKELVVS